MHAAVHTYAQQAGRHENEYGGVCARTQRGHSDRIAQRVLVVRRGVVDVPQGRVRQAQVAVRNKLAGDVRDGEMLRVVLDRARQALLVGPELHRHTDAVARERLTHRVTRLERRTKELLCATTTWW